MRAVRLAINRIVSSATTSTASGLADAPAVGARRCGSGSRDDNDDGEDMNGLCDGPDLLMKSRPMNRTGPHSFLRVDLPADLAARVFSARRRAGLSRRHAAARAGVDYRTLARIERGAQLPSMATLLAIARSWRIDLVDLAPAWRADQDEIEVSGLQSPGPALRRIRKARGVSLTSAAAAAGVALATLSRFERGLAAPGRITAMGDRANGAIGDYDLAITSSALASLLGHPSATALTNACRA